MNIVSDRDSFVWKGHDKLTAKQSVSYRNPGYQASSILQLHPPAAVTAMHCHADWSIVAAGTAHGLAIYDMVVRHCFTVWLCFSRLVSFLVFSSSTLEIPQRDCLAMHSQPERRCRGRGTFHVAEEVVQKVTTRIIPTIAQGKESEARDVEGQQVAAQAPD